MLTVFLFFTYLIVSTQTFLRAEPPFNNHINNSLFGIHLTILGRGGRLLIQQFTREGAWITQYYMHFRTANEFLKIARLAETEYQREWKRLSMEHDDESYVGHLLRELEHKITRYATASEVFCCLSIEAFINFYGTADLEKQLISANSND